MRAERDVQDQRKVARRAAGIDHADHAAAERVFVHVHIGVFRQRCSDQHGVVIGVPRNAGIDIVIGIGRKRKQLRQQTVLHERVNEKVGRADRQNDA